MIDQHDGVPVFTTRNLRTHRLRIDARNDELFRWLLDHPDTTGRLAAGRQLSLTQAEISYLARVSSYRVRERRVKDQSILASDGKPLGERWSRPSG